MLKIKIPSFEYYDEKNNIFGKTKDTELQLEHSLLSVSKWEAKWHKAFLSKEEKTIEECIDYVKCMTITQNVDEKVYMGLNNEHFEIINKYIENPMTATWFNEKETKGLSRQVVTSEIIYYWMIALNVPFECQKWHINRLLTLIRVCNIKNAPNKKANKQEQLRQQQAINKARRMKYGTKG